MTRSRPSPDLEALDVLVEFLNTFHAELDRESLSTPADVTEWARQHDLGAGLDEFDDADLSAARVAREALRSYVAGGQRGADGSALARSMAEVRLAPSLADGELRLLSVGGGWPLLWGRLVGVLHQVQVEGRSSRLKVCPGSNCAWAFHDRSKNNSRTWCSDQVCGARTRSRNYRRRHRPAG